MQDSAALGAMTLNADGKCCQNAQEGAQSPPVRRTVEGGRWWPVDQRNAVESHRPSWCPPCHHPDGRANWLIGMESH